MATIAEALQIALQHHQAGRLDLAEEIYRRILQVEPAVAAAEYYLGGVLSAQGHREEAVEAYRRALQIEPGLAEAENNLANVLNELARPTEAEAACRRALALRPGYAEAENNLGIALQAQSRLDEAEAALRRALAGRPEFVAAAVNLGGVLQAAGRHGDAIEILRQAVAIHPSHPAPAAGLATVLQSVGLLDEARSWYGHALEINPQPAHHSNLLMCEQYSASATAERLARLHAEWDRRYARPLTATWRPHANQRDPRRLPRLGFVSPDLGQHPVGHFVGHVLEHLKRQGIEVVCYSDRPKEDSQSARIRQACTLWRAVAGMADEALAEVIRADRVDILFDLAGHTADHRLLVFARKPAPIQVTWLGYEGTTGLGAMDYLLADRCHVPAGEEPHYVERVLRMPGSYLCFEPPAGAPEVAPLPALARGYVTFGSFNNIAKVTPEAAAVWAQILLGVAGSRLVLKHRTLGDEFVRRRYLDLFAAHGIGADRLDLVAWLPYDQRWTVYHGIDLALDPFPYNGATTTCEALWMGVPVLTCPGRTFASRHGYGFLSTLGETGTVAEDPAHYVELARRRAADLPRLAALRARLRATMAASLLCDGPRFAADLLDLLRGAWRQWCA